MDTTPLLWAATGDNNADTATSHLFYTQQSPSQLSSYSTPSHFPSCPKPHELEVERYYYAAFITASCVAPVQRRVTTRELSCSAAVCYLILTRNGRFPHRATTPLPSPVQPVVVAHNSFRHINGRVQGGFPSTVIITCKVPELLFRALCHTHCELNQKPKETVRIIPRNEKINTGASPPSWVMPTLSPTFFAKRRRGPRHCGHTKPRC